MALPGLRPRGLSAIGLRPGDQEELRLRKQTLVVTATTITAAATFWTASYVVLGQWGAAAIPGGYQVATLLGLVYFRATGDFTTFRRLELGLMLVLPFALQWVLGGYAASGAISLWALFAPIGALALCGPRAALPWLGGFVALSALSGVLDPRLDPAGLPEGLVLAYFVLNAATIGALTFAVLRYFLRELAAARAASESLLLAILPAEIAARLKEGDGRIADDAVATVLFADLVGFTELATRTPPRELVDLLDDLFGAWDELAEREGVEKIKTLGDGYLAVAGIPHAREDHAAAVARFALALRTAVARASAERSLDLSVRVGIQSGPVVAGVIGRRRFGYDLWGDTVNTASRLEALAEPGTILVGGRTAELLGDAFALAPLGPQELKGRGPVAAYVLEGAAAPSERSTSSTIGRSSGRSSPSA